jgi:hypothetical protein
MGLQIWRFAGLHSFTDGFSRSLFCRLAGVVRVNASGFPHSGTKTGGWGAWNGRICGDQQRWLAGESRAGLHLFLHSGLIVRSEGLMICKVGAVYFWGAIEG